MARVGTAIIVVAIIAAGIYLTQHTIGGRTRTRVSDSPTSTVTTASIQAGGTLIEGDVGVPSTFNPLFANSQTERDLARLLFDGLVRVDGSGTPRPDLAEKWDVSSNGLAYTVMLKSGLTWHDGAPVTSQDVRFTIGLIQSPGFPGNPQLSQFWRPVVVDTPDDRTVVFHLMKPFSPFLNYLNLPILPKHILGGVLAEDLTSDPFNFAPIGTGPFRFRAYEKQQQEIKLDAFASYSGDKPKLTDMTIRYFDDPTTLLAALKNGSVQATGTLPADQLLRAGALPASDSVYAPILMGYTALFFNTRVPPFSNQVVRQAIQLAIDPAELTNGPLKSQVVPGTGPIPETSWAYSAQSVVPDPQRATAMLEQAGWTYVEKDDMLKYGDMTLSFQLLVNADDPQRMLMAQTIAQQLARIHIRVEVQPASSAAVSQALTSRQFSAAVFGGNYPNGDPDCLDVWLSTQASTGLNFTGISDPAIDTALLNARGTSDVEKRRQYYAQFQHEFATQVPAVVLYYPRFLFVASSALRGVKPEPVVDPSDRFLQISSWYLAGAGVPRATP